MNINNKYTILLLPFICFIAGYLLSALITGNKTYITPRLTGMSIYEAIKTTSPHQINIRILSEKESEHVPAGTIISQKPSAGRAIKTHQPIFVTTTKMPPQTTAPQLLQLQKTDINKICHDLNLKAKTYYLEYQAPSYSCIGQLPESTHIVHDHKIITYLAKDKLNMYLMPDLTKQPLKLSLELLQNYTDKVTVYMGTQKQFEPYPENATIINQKPLAGSLISIQPTPLIQLEIIH